jgi:catechol 2,3-dioxygenase
MSPPVLHHVNLKTLKMDELIDWYGTVVGMRVHHKFPGGAWLSNDDANHRLALLTSPQLSEPQDKLLTTGMHHLAFEYASLQEMFEQYARLRGLDILPHAALDHGMTISLYYVDPDGNSVELQADAYGDWAQSTEFVLTSPEFKENPIGHVFDPDRVLEALRGGATAEEVHRRAYSGEFDPGTPLDLRFPVG